MNESHRYNARKKCRHKCQYIVRLHLYKAQEHAKLTYDDKSQNRGYLREGQ